MDKHDIAKVLDEIAELLEVQGENPFKVRAYRNAARAIESIDEDIHALVEEKRLQDLPGIGEKIAEKITTLIHTGHLPYYDELKSSIPHEVLQFLKLPGLGAKKTHLLYEQLGIKTLQELQEACKSNLIANLPGFGEKSQDKILKGLSKLKQYSARHLWWEAMQQAEPILEGLRALKTVTRAEIAGSLRRGLETVGDLDFLVASSDPEQVMEWFYSRPWVESVIARGHSKSAIRTKKGLQAEVRVLSAEQFAFGLIYYTGSKEHNIKIRQLAIKQGYSLSEYELKPHLFTGVVTEEKIYQALKLRYIPPELREDRGEIEAARQDRLPKLIEEKDLKGAFHCHTTESDGHNSLEEMVQASQNLGWQYIGIADHSKSSYQANGLSQERLYKQIEQIRQLNASKKFKTHIFSGLECDILTDGTLDFPDEILQELDYVVISIHRGFHLDEQTMTKRLIRAIENPNSSMVGHLTGRLLLKREPYAIDVEKVIDACIANGTIMELNGQPERLDMDWRYWHKAKEKGLKCVINPDAHSTKDLAYLKTGSLSARKGWLEKQDVINTLPLSRIRKFLSKY